MGSAVSLRFTWTIGLLGMEASYTMLCFTSELETEQDLGIFQEHIMHSYNSEI